MPFRSGEGEFFLLISELVSIQAPVGELPRALIVRKKCFTAAIILHQKFDLDDTGNLRRDVPTGNTRLKMHFPACRVER